MVINTMYTITLKHMSKHQLIDIASDNWIYPVTTDENVMSDGQSIRNVYSSRRYVDETCANFVNSTPERISVIDILKEKLNDSDDLVNIIINTIGDAKKMLFIDLWNRACGSNGRYNPETGYFELNGITDITYEQALDIWRYGPIRTAYCQGQYCGAPIRTNLPITTGLSGGGGSDYGYLCTLLFTNSQLEVIRLNNRFRPRYTGSTSETWTYGNIFNAKKCHTILGTIDLLFASGKLTQDHFGFQDNLVNIQMNNLQNVTFVTFKLCSKLSFDSLNFLVKNAANKSELNIEVHPNIYSAIMNDGSVEYPFNGGDESDWSQLLEVATENKITFSTL